MLNVTDIKRIHSWEPVAEYHLPCVVVTGSGCDRGEPVANTLDSAVFDVGGIAHALECVPEYTKRTFSLIGTTEDWFAGEAGEYKRCINNSLVYIPAGFWPKPYLPFGSRLSAWQNTIAINEILMPQGPQINWVERTVCREQNDETIGVTYTLRSHELANFIGGVGATVPLLNSRNFESRPVEGDATPEITGHDCESDDISVDRSFMDQRLRSDSTETAKTAKTPEKTSTNENAVGAVGAEDVRLPEQIGPFDYVWPDGSKVWASWRSTSWFWTDADGRRGTSSSLIDAARNLYAAGGARWYRMPEEKTGINGATVYKFADGSEVRNYQAGSDEWFWVNGSDYTSKHYDLKLQDFPSAQLAADDLYRNGGAR